MGYVVDYQEIMFQSLSGEDIFLFFFTSSWKKAANSVMHRGGFIAGGGYYSLAKIHINFQNTWSYRFCFSPIHLDFLDFIC